MQERAKVRVGIIGLGAIGHRIAQQIHNRADTEVTFVCDLNESLAQQISSGLGGVAYTTDYHTMLNRNQVDLVYVGVPPKFHHAVAADVINAGKHIFCEKPLALHLDEARDMVHRAHVANIVNVLNLPLYGDPGVRAFAQRVKDGYLGELRHIDVAIRFPQWPRPWQVNPWIGGREQGGMIREVGPHLFDVILRQFGPVQQVEATMHYPSADPVACETAAIGKLILASGHTVNVHAQLQADAPEVVSITAHGTQGMLALVDWATPLAAKIGSALQPIPVEGQHPDWSTQLAAAVRGEAADLCYFSVGLDIQEVLDAWERSAEAAGKAVDILRKLD